MALSFRFATESDIPALLKPRLAVDANQTRRFGKNRWSTTINERSVARGLKSSRVLLARRHGRMSRSRGSADCRRQRSRGRSIWDSLTPVAKAVYLHDVDVDPLLQRSEYRASAYRARESCCPRVACRGDSPRRVRRSHQVADGFSGSADSSRSGAQSIAVCRLSTSSACSRLDRRSKSSWTQSHEVIEARAEGDTYTGRFLILLFMRILILIAVIVALPMSGAGQRPRRPLAQSWTRRFGRSWSAAGGAWRDLNVPESDGRVLHDLVLKHKYTRALEIGTSTGHSGVWIAWALAQTGGKLVTVEINFSAQSASPCELQGSRPGNLHR